MTLATAFRALLLLSFFTVLYLVYADESAAFFSFGFSTLIYISTLLILSYARIGEAQALATYFLFLSTFWCVLRLVFLNASIDSVNYAYLIDFDHNDMALTVIMLTFSSIALFVGMAIGGAARPPRRKVRVPIIASSINLRFLPLHLLLLLAWLMLGSPLIEATGSKLLAIFGMAFTLDSLILLATAVCVYRYDMSSPIRIVMYILLVSYVILRVVMGSKSGLYVVATGVLLAILVFNHRYRLKLRSVAMATLIVAFALAFFLVGTEARAILTSMSAQGDLVYGELVSSLISALSESIASFDAMYWIEIISRRLSMYDYLNVMFTGDTVSDHLGIVYGLKSLWNVVTPPFLSFDEATLFQANLFKVAYGAFTFDDAATNYHTDMLPLFGALYVNFGALWLIPIIIFGYVSARIFIYMDCLKLKEHLYFKMLWIYFFGDFLFGMGVVSTIQQILFFTVIPLITYFLLQRLYLGLLQR